MASRPPKRTAGGPNPHMFHPLLTTHLDRAHETGGPVVDRGFVARKHGPDTVIVHKDGSPDTYLILRRKGSNWVPIEE